MMRPTSTNAFMSLNIELAIDGLRAAARLIAINGLMAESAAGRGDLAEAFARFRLVDSALQEARELVAIAGGIAK